ncbi:MAG: DEAD/DEAH box helicase family protein [Acidobacteria bacterium]|nr:DEAD/DEAH box helicase family protein [Acidobacteriota bacterium]
MTAYHAKYFAHELTKRCASDNVAKLATALSNAQVDLNPHQIEAALFAFRSPLSKGVILADEVGLGKTIEAGILLSQKWAEGRRRLLIICPANLRKQWSEELAEKFFLPSTILETRTFNDAVRAGKLNPFQSDAAIICSYQFARAKEPYVRQTHWDLVAIDEAHRLRNVYKANNKISNAIKQAVFPFQKVLLTATPLQNSLLELYGLVSIIDEFTFGDLKSFRAQFAHLNGDAGYDELKQRLQPVCKRTLRKQVLEYVKYTNRHALVQEFTPSVEEQRLYDLVSRYLQKDRLYALPASQRQLMTLILRKLLASSTYAISDTLEGLAGRLQEIADAAEHVTTAGDTIAGNFEDFPEIEDEWDEVDEHEYDAPGAQLLSPEQLIELKQEMTMLREFHTLAKSIVKNSKGEVLLTALRRGFAASEQAQKSKGVPALQQKALIFTESRRTQEYLYQILERTEFAGKIVLFNGSNTDPKSNEIYKRWLHRHGGTDVVTNSPTADKRAALIEYFRDEAAVMIATEAAAEGINLQFCNLVVNYDLPWNPQRIEQRIGRCHRYGQKFDVVVVNFLNRSNAADVRVYQLLDEKFRLFNGVFGASDEVLGSIESGIDFEKRIVNIYQRCRTPEQISFEFDQLQKDLETEIDDRRKEAREQLLNNFDQEVVEKVRVTSGDYLDRFEEWLWQVTTYYLGPYARFDGPGHSFVLERNPFEGEQIHPGPYRLGKRVEDANTYRIGHPLAQRILTVCKNLNVEVKSVRFDYQHSGKRIAVIEHLIGQQGWLLCSRASLTAFETEDYLLFAGIADGGDDLDHNQCRRLFDLPGKEEAIVPCEMDVRSRCSGQIAAEVRRISARLAEKNGVWFDAEMDKLDRWAEDQRGSLKADLEELDTTIKDLKRQARSAPNLPSKLDLQRQLRQCEAKRNEAWRNFDSSSRELERKKDALLDDISQRLNQNTELEDLFMLRWHVV